MSSMYFFRYIDISYTQIGVSMTALVQTGDTCQVQGHNSEKMKRKQCTHMDDGEMYCSQVFIFHLSRVSNVK